MQGVVLPERAAASGSWEGELAIELERVSKHFTLYHNQSDRLKTRVLGRFYSRYRRTPERFAALEDISFSVRRGQAFGLIGANGSGKSTLLQIIAGILVPDTGEVRVRGRVAPLIELGAGFHPELTGNENIFLNASLYGMTNRHKRPLHQGSTPPPAAG